MTLSSYERLFLTDVLTDFRFTVYDGHEGFSYLKVYKKYVNDRKTRAESK